MLLYLILRMRQTVPMKCCAQIILTNLKGPQLHVTLLAPGSNAWRNLMIQKISQILQHQLRAFLFPKFFFLFLFLILVLFQLILVFLSFVIALLLVFLLLPTLFLLLLPLGVILKSRIKKHCHYYSSPSRLD